MAYPAYIVDKARQMRLERQMTIDEIAARLALPRTTVFYWVRDLPIARSGSGGGWPESARRAGNRAMQAKCRKLRENAYAEGLEEFAELCRKPGFRDFVCLYLAEGYKRNRNSVAIGNSDAAVVRLSSEWIKRFTVNKVRYAIQYHADQDLNALGQFWSTELGIEPEQISMQRKSNSNHLSKRTWRSVNGVLTVSVGDTMFRARLEAWMDLLRRSWV